MNWNVNVSVEDGSKMEYVELVCAIHEDFSLI